MLKLDPTRREMERECGLIEAALFLGIVGAWEFLLISTFLVYLGATKFGIFGGVKRLLLVLRSRMT